jgi:hypothetical protein
MPNVPIVGAELLAAGADVFLRQMTRADNATRAFVNTTQSVSPEFNKSMMAASAFGSVVGNVVGPAINNIIGTMARATQQTINFGKAAVLTAGRFDQMIKVASMMGEKQGYNADQVEGFITGVRKSGIEAGIAANLVTEMARSELDMAKSTDLARVAQDAAIISNSNSSETLARLQYGITRYDIMILRTAGIMVDSQKAFQKYAETIGKTAKELSATEKQAAFLNAVLEEGKKIAGAYDTSMRSGYKIMGSMTRIFDDIAVAIGGPFQESFYQVMKTAYEVGGAFSKMLVEGGALYPMLQTVGAGMDIVTTGFKNWAVGSDEYLSSVKYTKRYLDDLKIAQDASKAGSEEQAAALQNVTAYQEAYAIVTDESKQGTEEYAAAMEVTKGGMLSMADVYENNAVPAIVRATEAIKNATSGIGDEFETMAMNAFDWGANIIIEFASGMVTSVASVLAEAMNYISNAIAYWLAPGSPPRVAQELPEWGQSAMAQYLHGFAEADFDALGSLQSVFQSTLGTMSAAGQIDKNAVGGAFLGLSESLISSLGDGKGSASLFSKMADSFGPLNGEVKTLVDLYFQLTDATNALRQASEDWSAAAEKERQKMAESSMMAAQYNAMLNSGADPSVLAAKKKEFDIVKDEMFSYAQIKKDAEDTARAKQQEIENTKSQIGLQAKIVQQMNQLVKSGLTPEEAAEKIKKEKKKKLKEKKDPKAKGGSGGGSGLPDFGDPAGGNTLSSALDGAKNAIATKMAEIAKTIKEKLNEAFKNAFGPDTEAGKALKSFTDAWDNLKTTLSGIYEDYFKDLPGKLSGLIPDDFIANLGWAAGLFLLLGTGMLIVSIVGGILSTILGSVLLPIIGLVFFVAILKTVWEDITPMFEDTSTTAGKLKDSLWQLGAAFYVAGIMVWDSVMKIVNSIDTQLGPSSLAFVQSLASLGMALVNLFAAITPILTLVIVYVGLVASSITTFMGYFVNMIVQIMAGIVNIVSGVVNIISSIFNGLVGVILGDSERLWAAENQLITGFVQVFGGATQIIAGFFQNMIDGMISSFGNFIGKAYNLMADMMGWASWEPPAWLSEGLFAGTDTDLFGTATDSMNNLIAASDVQLQKEYDIRDAKQEQADILGALTQDTYPRMDQYFSGYTQSTQDAVTQTANLQGSFDTLTGSYSTMDSQMGNIIARKEEMMTGVDLTVSGLTMTAETANTTLEGLAAKFTGAEGINPALAETTIKAGEMEIALEEVSDLASGDVTDTFTTLSDETITGLLQPTLDTMNLSLGPEDNGLLYNFTSLNTYLLENTIPTFLLLDNKFIETILVTQQLHAVFDGLEGRIKSLEGSIEGLISRVGDLKDALADLGSVQLGVLEENSPQSILESRLWGVQDTMHAMATRDVPELQRALSALGGYNGANIDLMASVRGGVSGPQQSNVVIVPVEKNTSNSRTNQYNISGSLNMSQSQFSSLLERAEMNS